jgi:hypothetical protein
MELTGVEEEGVKDEYSIKRSFACDTSDFKILVAFCQTFLLCFPTPHISHTIEETDSQNNNPGQGK